jgi:galactokinase
MIRAFWAPGRVNLIGEHTDYTGGLVLPAALDLGVRIEGVAAEGRIALHSDQFEPVELDPHGSLDGVTGWGRYAAAVAAELDALGRPPIGFSGHVTSTVPGGAGLSSSAALEVAVATALCAVAEFPLEPTQLALAAQRAEHSAVGVPCGIMDQAASVLGVAGHAILLDTDSLEHRAIALPPELALVIVDSGVRHRLADSGYAQRRRELEQALVVLDGRRPADVTPEEAAERAAAAQLDPVLTRRLRHVVTENARVREVVTVLTETPSDLAGLGELFRAGHESLRRDFEVTTAELDLLVELAYRAGAVAARMTGGGFGGSIVALAEGDRAQGLADEIVGAYAQQTGISDSAAWVTQAADGARELL